VSRPGRLRVTPAALALATPGYVYILATRRNGTLYVGATSNLVTRVAQHRANEVPGYTMRYRVHRLVHVEAYADIRDAVARERRLKKWRRVWKLALIEALNPDWVDLWPRLGYAHNWEASTWHPPPEPLQKHSSETKR
jgi:putative endonuclease